MLSLKNLRLVFLLKCIISAKFFLSYYKSNFEIFTGPESFTALVFYFSIFHFDDFLTTFAKDFMKKPTIFKTNIKSTHNFLHFHKDLRYWNFWQWNDGLFKKAADFDKSRKEKILKSPNLSNMARGTLILKDCDIASYPYSNYGPSNLLF